MKELLRDYLDGRLSRRDFLAQVAAAGFSAAAAESLLAAADRGAIDSGDAAVADLQARPAPRSSSGPPRFVELTMPLDHEYMPDDFLPTATKFVLAPTGDPNKGITLGTETGTCLTLPSQFSEFRKTRRLHEIPPETLVLRDTVVVPLAKQEEQEITPADVDRALGSADFRNGDAVLVRTGWGDKEWHRTPGTRYLLRTPRLSTAAAERLAQAMSQRNSDLLLTDLAAIAFPGAHLAREWLATQPVPEPWPSAEADSYLRHYSTEKMQADYAAALALARAGIMTVKRLVNCARLTRPRVRIIVGPLHLVRGIGSTCRVVAVEEA